MWTVTRQAQWSTGNNVVEISSGGLDYSNPDAFSKKYRGELEEYENPVEAVEAAIKIAEAWRQDLGCKTILIDHGATGGMTMPFDGMPLNRETRKVLRQWAKERLEELPKCDQCGETIFGDAITLYDFPDWQFCGEYCAEKWYSEQIEQIEEPIEV